MKQANVSEISKEKFYRSVREIQRWKISNHKRETKTKLAPINCAHVKE